MRLMRHVNWEWKGELLSPLLSADADNQSSFRIAPETDLGAQIQYAYQCTALCVGRWRCDRRCQIPTRRTVMVKPM